MEINCSIVNLFLSDFILFYHKPIFLIVTVFIYLILSDSIFIFILNIKDEKKKKEEIKEDNRARKEKLKKNRKARKKTQSGFQYLLKQL